MLELFFTDKDNTGERAGSNVLTLTIENAATGVLDLKFNPLIPAQYEYLFKVIHVYPPNVGFTFRILSDPLSNNTYQLVKEVVRAPNTEALVFSDADVALPFCYKFPTRIEIENTSGAEVDFVVYLSYKEVDKD